MSATRRPAPVLSREPVPALPLVLGITGHRDLREEDREALEAFVGGVFTDLRARYPHTPDPALPARRGGRSPGRSGGPGVRRSPDRALADAARAVREGLSDFSSRVRQAVEAGRRVVRTADTPRIRRRGHPDGRRSPEPAVRAGGRLHRPAQPDPPCALGWRAYGESGGDRPDRQVPAGGRPGPLCATPQSAGPDGQRPGLSLRDATGLGLQPHSERRPAPAKEISPAI